MNGGQAAEVPGTWSASLEWLVGRLAPRYPGVGFVEVRYRVKSWRRLDSCVADAREALAAVPVGARVCLLGFSMGGAVSISVADDPRVERVIGIAPWLPPELDVSALAGRPFASIHGSLDRPLPGLPGVSPHRTAAGLERIRAAGGIVTAVEIRGGFHGVALRSRLGLVRLPRAGAFERAVASRLDEFVA